MRHDSARAAWLPLCPADPGRAPLLSSHLDEHHTEHNLGEQPPQNHPVDRWLQPGGDVHSGDDPACCVVGVLCVWEALLLVEFLLSSLECSLLRSLCHVMCQSCGLARGLLRRRQVGCEACVRWVARTSWRLLSAFFCCASSAFTWHRTRPHSWNRGHPPLPPTTHHSFAHRANTTRRLLIDDATQMKDRERACRG